MSAKFYTLFDSGYFLRGLAMLRSLKPKLRPGDELAVLALDDRTAQALSGLMDGQIRVLRIEDLSDRDLEGVRSTRPHREFCWTCTPALSDWAIRRSAENDIVVYIDADLLFFQDPYVLLSELDGDRSILIHEHRFSDTWGNAESTAGRFNVGMVAFKVGAESRACSERWRAQTIDQCVAAAENFCGDQMYLNEWPSLYRGLQIMQNIGGGVAPWNVDRYDVASDARGPIVDGTPVIFYHYQSTEILSDRQAVVVGLRACRDYKFHPSAIDAFYRPYARALRAAAAEAMDGGYRFDGDRICGSIAILWRRLFGRYVMLD